MSLDSIDIKNHSPANLGEWYFSAFLPSPNRGYRYRRIEYFADLLRVDVLGVLSIKHTNKIHCI